MIEVKNISKKFNNNVVLNGIDLNINKGDVVAIIGPSGTGKSTFLRCLNRLEKPESGSISIGDLSVDLARSDKKSLVELRKKTSMVFQGFNLFSKKTALENVMEGLIIVKKMDKKKAEEIAREQLKNVGLLEWANHYPAHLSGGQQQRVAIARALASDPKILLCDEATSALDPQTTASILSLLKEINEKLGITIVIITHQMSVIREICSHVAIIEHGVLVEDGLVEDIFSHPKSKAAKELILRDQPGNNNAPLANAVQERMQGDKKIRIVFSENSAFEPVIANMILQFKTPVNILRADTKNVGGVAKGEMILGLPEDRHLQVDIEEYLKEKGLAVEEVTEDVE